MGRCDVCGNEYEKTMVIIGVEAPDGRHFCCAHCAEMAGVAPREINA
jgi:hypothetical protein